VRGLRGGKGGKSMEKNRLRRKRCAGRGTKKIESGGGIGVEGIKVKLWERLVSLGPGGVEEEGGSRESV